MIPDHTGRPRSGGRDFHSHARHRRLDAGHQHLLSTDQPAADFAEARTDRSRLHLARLEPAVAHAQLEVEAARAHYDPVSIIEQNEDLRRVLNLLEIGHFNQFEPGIFDGILQSVKSPWDPWMTAADFASYVEAQRRAAEAYQDQEDWTRMSILNCAASGKFSTDRTIAEYNRDIWKLQPVPAVPVK